MWNVYWTTVRGSSLDWGILAFGMALIMAHLLGLLMRWQGRFILFVQNLDRYRAVCLSLTELLPILGLLATVLSLMNTFQGFHNPSGEAPDLAQTITSFAPALSGTLSGLLMIVPNLILNSLLWLAAPQPEKGE